MNQIFLVEKKENICKLTQKSSLDIGDDFCELLQICTKKFKICNIHKKQQKYAKIWQKGKLQECVMEKITR